MAPQLERSPNGDADSHLSAAPNRAESVDPLPRQRHSGEPPGLSDRVDAALQRIDGLRDRPGSALAVAAAITVVVFAGWWLGRPGSAAPVEAAIPMASTTTAAPMSTSPPTSSTSVAGSADPSSIEPETLLVHVAGAVARPGIVELDGGARIGDAVTAAGGPTEEADLHRLNLAAPVVDGLQIRVPIEGEEVSPVGVPAATSGSGPGGRHGLASGPLNLNSAGEAELETLPGIGPSLAAAIVEWRTNNGPFLTIDGLLDVPGIGPAKLAGLIDDVSL